MWALGELLRLLEGEGPAHGGIPGSSLEVPLHDLLVTASIVKRPFTEHTLGATSGFQVSGGVDHKMQSMCQFVGFSPTCSPSPLLPLPSSLPPPPPSSLPPPSPPMV